jgi:predicted ATPase
MASLGTVLFEWTLVMQGKTTNLEDMRCGLLAWRETGASLLVPYYLARMSECHMLLGEFDAAIECVNEAENISATNGETWWLPEILRLKAEAQRSLGIPENQVARTLASAIRLAERIGSVPLIQGISASVRRE